MNLFYPMFIAFILVFISELGDKTQLLVLSFSSKLKMSTILIGVALGSFVTHGIAILFGSSIGLLGNEKIHNLFQLLTYLSFIFFGILSFLPQKIEKELKKDNFISKLSSINLGYIFIIALSIIVGELGDKTFLASIGLGINYPNQKVFLIIGSVLGMVLSNTIAILFGKILNKYISEEIMQKISGMLFLVFGFIGLIRFFIL